MFSHDAAAAPVRHRVIELRALLPGMALAALVAIVAVLGEGPLARLLAALSGQPIGIPAMVIALLIGIALNRAARRPVFAPGMSYCVSKILRIAVALLGIRIALGDIVALGAATAALVIGAMALTVMSGLWLGRLFGQTDPFGALAGCATAVCGASAALATANVLPDYPNKPADTVFVVVAVNALSTVAMVAYPALCTLIGLDERTTGIMLGATIHDVAQVAGAGYAVSDAVGNNAVIVKLLRVFLLLPVVLSIGWYFAARGGHTERAKVPVPAFALVFLALVVINSLGIVPTVLKTILIEASRDGLLLAIAALGLATSVNAIARTGWRQIAVVIGTTFVILAAATAALMAMP